LITEQNIDVGVFSIAVYISLVSHVGSDPDQDPDPTFHFDADPDSVPHPSK
jgi:hypothetical protein